MRLLKCFTIGLVLLGLTNALLAQDTRNDDSLPQETGIKLSAFVEQNNVPLNRAATLVIRLEWFGDLDRYQTHPFDNPIVQNFEIVGSASSNKVAYVDGRKTAVHDYQFTLKPTTLGMGYIEGVILKYTDLNSDEDFSLSTNRIEVKVVDPLPEPGSKSWILWLFGIIFLASGIVVSFFIIRNKRAENQRRKEVEAAAAIPVEEIFLENLKKSIKLNNTDLDVAQGFSILSRLVRRFLKEKFNVGGLEATSESILAELDTMNADDRFINETHEILTTADRIKFSGGSGEKSELERSFTLFEAHLQKSLRGELFESIDDEENVTKE